LVGELLSSDLLTSSASGLDPDISPANVSLQALPVAKVRGLPLERVQALNLALQRWQTAQAPQTK
jgi:K+-transporting ATPase ATPase C chain